jgi:hypothetical protein
MKAAEKAIWDYQTFVVVVELYCRRKSRRVPKFALFSTKLITFFNFSPAWKLWKGRWYNYASKLSPSLEDLAKLYRGRQGLTI